MDYYSITSSELEWRSSICFCGSLSCRGTFLHFAAQDELQQILYRSCGPAWRVATLLRGCSETSVADQDLAVLRHHGIGDLALQETSPLWMKRYAIDTIRFLEHERKALPCALMRSSLAANNTTTATSTESKDNLIRSQYSFTSADGDARSVLEQRMQSLLCSFSLISKFLSKQTSLEISQQVPLKILSTEATLVRVWEFMKTIPLLLKKHLIQILMKEIKKFEMDNSSKTEKNSKTEKKKLMTFTQFTKKKKILELLEIAYKKLLEILENVKPTTMSGLRQWIREIRKIILSIQQYSIPTARLTLLGDVLVMWCHTTTFVEIQEYETVNSEPIEVVARELGTTTIAQDKLFKYLGENSKLLQQKLEQGEEEVEEEEEVEKGEDVILEEKNESDDGGMMSETEVETKVQSEIEMKNEMCYMEIVNETKEEQKNIISPNSQTTQCMNENLKSQRGGNRKKKTPIVSLNPNDVIFSGIKNYSSTYIFWQLIGWYNAGTELENEKPDLLGTCYLPIPSTCFGYSQQDYTLSHREIFLDHWNTNKTLSLSLPKIFRQCFNNIIIQNQSMMLLGSPVLDVNLGQVHAVENCLIEIFSKKKIPKKIEIFGQYDLNLPPEKPTAWVQCEKCLKWRRVPFHVNVDTLPEQWYCENNSWDLEKAHCHFPQDQYDAEKEATLTSSLVTDDLSSNSVVGGGGGGGGGGGNIKEGEWKDVYCLRNEVYYEARAMKIRTKKGKGKGEVSKTEIRFHFKGWKPAQDEWIDSCSDRIAPHHFYTNVGSRTIRAQEQYQGLAPEVTDSERLLPSETAASSSPSLEGIRTMSGGKKRGKKRKDDEEGGDDEGEGKELLVSSQGKKAKKSL
jgi:hypothetical protein